MNKKLQALAALPWICSCFAATAEPAPSFVPACEITRVVMPGGVHLEAIVRGPAGASGEYSLAIEKSSAGGRSAISQGGEFALDRMGYVVLAADDFDLGMIDAKLSVRLSGTNLHCLSGRLAP